MKVLSASIIVLGVCLIISSWLVSNAIINSKTNFPTSIGVNQTSNEQFELIVSDGWIYLYDKTDGEVWKKSDDVDSNWEKVKHYTSY